MKKSGRFSGLIDIPEGRTTYLFPGYSIWFDKVAPGQSVEVSADLKTEIGKDSQAYITIECMDLFGRRIELFSSPTDVPDEGWRTIQVSGVLPKRTDKIRVTLHLHGPGKAWYDNAKISIRSPK